MLRVRQGDGAVLDANPAALHLYGYPREDLLGLTLAQLEALPDAAGQPRHRIQSGQLCEVAVQRSPWDPESDLVWVTDRREISDLRRELEERCRFERLISQLSSLFARRENLDSAIDEALRKIGHFAQADRTYVFLTRGHSVIDNTHEWCREGVSTVKPELQNIPMEDYPWFYNRMRQQLPIHVQDLDEFPPEAQAEREIIASGDVRSLLCLPMCSGAHLLGFVGMDNVRTEGRWSAVQVESLRIFADLISSALVVELSSERLTLTSAALNASGRGVMIVNRWGQIDWVNEASLLHSGRSQEELVGQCLLPECSEDHVGLRFPGELWETVLRGESWMGEITGRRRDGETYPAEVSVTPLRDRLGQVSHFVAIVRDLTQAKQVENELLRARKIESVGRLAVGLAHDFNNKLAIIISQAELLADKLHEPHDRAALEEIVLAASQSGELTAKLLGLASKQPAQPVLLDFYQAIAASLPRLRQQLPKSCQLVWTPPPELPSVLIDHEQLEQILLILVTNAAESGAQRIDIAAEHLPEPSRLKLTIQDDGPGMDEATLARTFEPFFSTKDGPGVRGLGLPTVYGIIKQYSGRVEIESTLHQGTLVSIELPLPAREFPAAEPAAPGELPSEQPTLLVVDDEAALLRLTRRLLERQGYQVMATESPETALSWLQDPERTFDLLVTDVSMPGLDGGQLWSRAHRLRPNLRCLFISGYPAEVLESNGTLPSHALFLQKPFTHDRLSESVRQALNSPQ